MGALAVSCYVGQATGLKGLSPSMRRRRISTPIQGPMRASLRMAKSISLQAHLSRLGVVPVSAILVPLVVPMNATTVVTSAVAPIIAITIRKLVPFLRRLGGPLARNIIYPPIALSSPLTLNLIWVTMTRPVHPLVSSFSRLSILVSAETKAFIVLTGVETPSLPEPTKDDPPKPRTTLTRAIPGYMRRSARLVPILSTL